MVSSKCTYVYDHWSGRLNVHELIVADTADFACAADLALYVPLEEMRSNACNPCQYEGWPVPVERPAQRCIPVSPCLVSCVTDALRLCMH